ncbi:MAG: phosphoenolpyruvate mutase [Synoicihabitans sp.]
MQNCIDRSKTVYVGMTADIIHPGHINILREAQKHGRVIVGLLTDKAVVEHKRLPYLNYEQRRDIITNLKGVDEVVPQNEWDYCANVQKYRPDFMIHGDDWQCGSQTRIRDRVFALMSQWGGIIIEIPYTRGVSSGGLVENARHQNTTPDIRRGLLRRLLDAKPLVRVLEVHNPISALIVENAFVEIDDQRREFDAMWSSSLTTSAVLGKPDIEAVDHTTRLSIANDMFEVTSKPMIYDGDTGGHITHLQYTVRALDRLGVSAAIFEDKEGLKRNSLLGNEVEQIQAAKDDFCTRLSSARIARVTDDFMIIARIESLILAQGIEDALARAFAYVEAGADGIMIHSRQSVPDEVFAFCREFRQRGGRVPIVVVPTSYAATYEQELQDAGANVVIYANHLLRAAYPAMWKTAHNILTHQRALEADQDCMPIKDILGLIPETAV